MKEPQIDGIPLSACSSEDLRASVDWPIQLEEDDSGVSIALAEDFFNRYAGIILAERGA